MNDQHGSHDAGTQLPGRAKQVFVLFAIVAAFFLLAEHRAHVLPYLPWLLLAACPLMHLFMHHGTHREHGHDAAPAPEGKTSGEAHHD